jgi:uncharacterized protein YndB with AHSA1/START domain
MKRVSHTYIQSNSGPPEKVFPLLCPVREAEWVPDWKYRLIYSKSGFAELGCVFATPNEDGRQTTWIVTDYDPPRRISFAWILPDLIATRLTIFLEPNGSERTNAHVTYEYTALSNAGERELDSYNETWYIAKMAGWEKAINHFLETGTIRGATAPTR